MIPIDERLVKTSIYFIQAECCGLIKIGWSHDAQRRFNYLSRFSACKLQLLAVRSAPISTEHDYHSLYRAHRRHGEWFFPHPDILAEIAEINGTVATRERSHELYLQGLYQIAAGNGPDAQQARSAIAQLQGVK